MEEKLYQEIKETLQKEKCRILSEFLELFPPDKRYDDEELGKIGSYRSEKNKLFMEATKKKYNLTSRDWHYFLLRYNKEPEPSCEIELLEKEDLTKMTQVVLDDLFGKGNLKASEAEWTWGKSEEVHLWRRKRWWQSWRAFLKLFGISRKKQRQK